MVGMSETWTILEGRAGTVIARCTSLLRGALKVPVGGSEFSLWMLYWGGGSDVGSVGST